MRGYSKEQIYEAIANSLREFGYKDASAEMIRDTHEAMKEGKTGADLPHNIIGRFAERQINDACESGLLS